MTLTVLLTLDGSDKDERALPVAASLVELAEGDLRVVRVFEAPVAELLPPVAYTMGGVDAAHELRAHVATSLRQTAARLEVEVHRKVTWNLLDGPDVAARLLDHIEAGPADFVVMATRAAGAVGRAIQGSVADRLVRESPHPVVLVPPRASYLRDKHIQLRRVLVPLDGSLRSLSAITHLLALPLAGELEFVLIQAVHAEPAGGYMVPSVEAVAADPGDSPNADEWIHVEARIAEQRLEEVAERLRVRGAVVEVRVVESADPAAVILDATRNDLVELIAMTTRGAGGLKRLVLGSVAERVVRHSEMPVLLVTARSSAPATSSA